VGQHLGKLAIILLCIYIMVGRMYKSKFEETIAEYYNLHDKYEIESIPYKIESNYNPDFKVSDTVYIETKGFFKDQDRRKIVAVKNQHPELTVIMFFQDSTVKLRKKGKMTYGDWCNKYNIPWFCWKTKPPTPRIFNLAIKSASHKSL
jgi:hypothetical protein